MDFGNVCYRALEMLFDQAEDREQAKVQDANRKSQSVDDKQQDGYRAQ